jgi:hypothetical protein
LERRTTSGEVVVVRRIGVERRREWVLERRRLGGMRLRKMRLLVAF